MRELKFAAIAMMAPMFASAHMVFAEEPGDIERLIARLASPSYRERGAAYRQLEAKGDAAIDVLRVAAGAADPEIAKRSAELIEQIERSKTRRAALAATYVSLTFENVPLVEAVEELSRRIGIKVTLHGDPERFRQRTVTFSTGRATVWQAVELFCHRAGLHEWDGVSALPPIVAHEGGQGHAAFDGVQVVGKLPVQRGQVASLMISTPAPRIALLDGVVPAPPCQHCGSVRIRARLLPKNEDIQSQDVLIGLQVSSEGRLNCYGAHGLRIDRAIDERGRMVTATEIRPEPSQDLSELPRRAFLRQNLNLAPRVSGPAMICIKESDPPPARLKELAGVMTLQAFLPDKEVELPWPKNRRPQVAAAGNVVIVSAEPSDYFVPVVVHARLPYGVQLQAPVANPAGAMGIRLGAVIRAPGSDIENDSLSSRSLRTDCQGLAMVGSKGGRWKVTQNDAEIWSMDEDSFVVRISATFSPPTPRHELGRLTFSVRRPLLVEVPFLLRDIPLK